MRLLLTMNFSITDVDLLNQYRNASLDFLVCSRCKRFHRETLHLKLLFTLTLACIKIINEQQ